MTSLPFVVHPRIVTEKVTIGNDQIGILEVTRKGYLTVAEKAFVDSVMQGSDGISQIVFLANKISKELRTTPEKAYMAITDVMQGKDEGKLNEAVANEYAEEIANITSKMSESLQRRAIAATTILIQTRVKSDWTIEDTLKLDPEFLNQFVALYEREDQREPVTEQSKEKEASDVVGK